jgi:putative RNA 2'-phosphotransferase
VSLKTTNRRFRALTGDDVISLVRSQHLERFEIVRGRIRALYGHTLPGVVAARPAQPPTRLFHGTAAEHESRIREEGLLPMRRGYVHLTSDLGYALQVARACEAPWYVLRVRATDAAESGVEFLTTAGHVWLASAIRPDFLDPLPVARG